LHLTWQQQGPGTERKKKVLTIPAWLKWPVGPPVEIGILGRANLASTSKSLLIASPSFTLSLTLPAPPSNSFTSSASLAPFPRKWFLPLLPHCGIAKAECIADGTRSSGQRSRNCYQADRTASRPSISILPRVGSSAHCTMAKSTSTTTKRRHC